MLVLRALVEFLRGQLTLLRRQVGVNVVWFHLGQVELLWTKDGAGSRNSYPADKALSGDLEVLHCPKTDESTSSAESGLAVDRDSSVVWLIEVRLNDVEEFSDDVVGWSRSVHEEEVIVCNTPTLKIVLIILGLIQPNYPRYANVFENFRILIWMVTIAMLVVSLLNRTHECAELTWDDPVEISVLDPFVIFILFDIKSAEIIPAESNGVLETLKAMQEGAIVEAVTLGCISIVLEDLVIWSELLVGLLRRHLEDDDHEGAHQESSVDHFVAGIHRGTIMEDAILLVVLIPEKSGELSCISVDHCEIERAEVLVEWEVGEIIVNIEEECILEVLWWLVIRNPIQFIYRENIVESDVEMSRLTLDNF